MAWDYELMKSVGALLGPFVGLVGGLSVAWVVDRAKVREAEEKKQEAIDAWLERFAITEGIEPILEFLHMVEQKQSDYPELYPELKLPISAINRMGYLLGHHRIGDILRAKHTAYLGKSVIVSGALEMASIYLEGELHTLMNELLSIKLADKGDIQNLKEVPSVKAISENINTIWERIVEAVE